MLNITRRAGELDGYAEWNELQPDRDDLVYVLAIEAAERATSGLRIKAYQELEAALRPVSDRLSAEDRRSLSDAALAIFPARLNSLYYLGVRVAAAIAYQLPRGLSTME